MTLALPPVWITSDFQAMDLPGVNASFDDLINKSQDLVEGVFSPVRDGSAKANEINERMREWYSQQVQEEETNPVQELAASLANFIEDSWNSGIHIYLTVPDYGGIGYARSALVSAMQSIDPDAPRFSDEMITTGVVLLFSGGRSAMLAACSSLLVLFGTDPQKVTQQMQLLTERSSPVAEIVEQMQEMGSTIQQNWSQEQKQLAQWFEKSSIKNFIDLKQYPLNLIKEAVEAVSAPSVDFSPKEVTRGQEFVFSLIFDSERAVGQDAVIQIGGLRLGNLTVSGNRASCTISREDWKSIGSLQSRMDVKIQRIVQGRMVPVATLGTIDIKKPGLNGIGDIFRSEPSFNEWRSFTVGETVANLIPGSTNIAKGAVDFLDDVATPTEPGDDFVGRAILTATQVASSTFSAASRFADGVNDTITAQLDELSALNLSAMVIPPSEGGNHQLIFSLGQGLSLDADNAPPAFEEQVSFALFLCAGVEPTTLSGKAEEAINTLNEVVRQVGRTFGVGALANWLT